MNTLGLSLDGTAAAAGFAVIHYQEQTYETYSEPITGESSSYTSCEFDYKSSEGWQIDIAAGRNGSDG